MGAGGDGMSCRDALGGRRDAAGVSGVSLVLSRVSPPSAPCAAVGRRVCGLACGVVLCFLHERGGALVLCSAPRCGRVWASRSVSLLRVGVPYSPTGCGGRALLTL